MEGKDHEMEIFCILPHLQHDAESRVQHLMDKSKRPAAFWAVIVRLSNPNPKNPKSEMFQNRKLFECHKRKKIPRLTSCDKSQSKMLQYKILYTITFRLCVDRYI